MNRAILAAVLMCVCTWSASAAVTIVSSRMAATSISGGSAPTWNESTNSAAFASSQSPTVLYPPVAANDILVVVFITNTPHNASGTPPGSFALKAEHDEGTGDTSTSIFWVRCSGSEPTSEAWTTIFDAAESGGAFAFAIRGCKTSGSPFDTDDTVESGADSTAQDITGITTSVNNVLVVGIIGVDPPAGGPVFTWDGGITERIDSDTVPSGKFGGNSAVYIGTKVQASAGATGSLGGDFDTTEPTAKFLYGFLPP
jgi:hypothetical protein